MQRVWKTVFNTLQAPSVREMERALVDHVVSQTGAVSVFTRPSLPSSNKRPRGVLLTLEALGLDSPAETAPEALRSAVDDVDPEELEEF